jgi:cytochrome c-type biogenesis protein
VTDGAATTFTRRVLSSALAVSVIGLAVGAALVGDRDGQLALGVLVFAGGWSARLQDAGAVLPLGYAFAAGMAAAFNPCGFALVPGYLALYIHGHDPGARRPLVRALGLSLTVTASFVVLFGAVGLALSVASTLISSALPWASVAVGCALIIAGARMLTGTPVYFGAAHRAGAGLSRAAHRADATGFAAYGFAFGLTSLACTLPLFLGVVGSALAIAGVLAAVAQFVLYGLGMGLVLTGLAIVTAVFGTGLSRIRGAGQALQQVGAILLLISGGYVMYYWLTIGRLLG